MFLSQHDSVLLFYVLSRTAQAQVTQSAFRFGHLCSSPWLTGLLFIAML
jgi:hypothetical protein